MAQSTQSKTIIRASKQFKTTYEYKSLLGLIGWLRQVQQEKVDDNLHIDIYEPEQYDKIYVNGRDVKHLLDNK